MLRTAVLKEAVSEGRYRMPAKSGLYSVLTTDSRDPDVAGTVSVECR